MTPLVIQLPLDPTGVSPDNLVSGEACTLTANRTYRAIAPLQGAFFANSLKVTDVATGKLLTDGSNGTTMQYYACEYYEQPSARYGQEIDAIIIIKDPSVSNNVTITYQALGGPYGTSAEAIIQQIEALGLDNRPVAWGDIIGKPSEFAPSKHLHDVGDVYGFEYVVHALDRIRDAIEIGDQASHDAIYAYVDAAIAQVQQANSNLQQQITNHLNDFNNPHRVTAALVGAYTKAQSDAITTPINAAVTNHIANKSNPHGTTVAQLNTYDGPTIDSKIATAMNQAKLTFTPTQQGGGSNQGNNKVYLGWDGARLRCQVDSTDLGGLVTYNEMSSNVSNLQNQINQKAPAGSPYAYTGQNQSVSFYDITANGTLYSANDVWAFISDERLKENFREINNARYLLKQLVGYFYEHNALAGELIPDLDTSLTYMGFKAGDIEKLNPRAVGPAPFDWDPVAKKSKSGQNYKTAQYEKLLPLVVNAVNAIDVRVDQIYAHLGLRQQEF